MKLGIGSERFAGSYFDMAPIEWKHRKSSQGAGKANPKLGVKLPRGLRNYYFGPPPCLQFSP
jgi:hypothetical protein